MAVKYDMTPDNYKLSTSFELINSEIVFKEAAIKDFIVDGEKLVKEKQEKLIKDLNALYQKNEELGRISEQHGHFHDCTVNESMQEAFLLASTSYLYSQFEFYLNEIAKRTAELFNIEISHLDLENYVPKKKNRRKKRLSKIDRIIFFIDETAKINPNIPYFEWDKIKLFQQARNCITHNNGYVSPNYPTMKILPYSNRGLSYDIDNNRISVNKEYLLEINKICFDFLNKTMEKVWVMRPRI